MSSSIEELKHLHIPLQDISEATNNFADENYIGLGGFGKVYRGNSEKHGAIAIKRLDRSRGEQGQGDHEFKTEIRLLSVYKHENIVSLLGFCDENGENILVYKYESKGSLDKHLTSTDLTWAQRLRICLNAARGLRYLHEDVALQHQIVHRDVKSANILLDENWKAKISDFGLSRTGPANVGSSFVITGTCGTLGYIDPEYFYTGHLTLKSDVFSFGVVLFEVLSGRSAFVKVDGQFFYVWIQKHYKRQTLDQIIHSCLHEQINTASLRAFSTIAYKCLSNGEERPNMKDVVEQLQKALKYQIAPSKLLSKVYSHEDDDDVAAFYQRQSKEAASSSQSPLATSQPLKYEVFLSFGGENTRVSFVDRLYSALKQRLVFHDDLLIKREPTGSSLIKAINESKSAIIVFSESYADSRWCLDELACIMKCRDERGLIVLPVFYHVDPSEVQRPNGRYTAALSRHELENSEKVESWRKALADAASLSGFVVTRHEVEAIEEIVYAVTHRYLSAQTDLIGIETRIQDLRSLLEIGSSGVRFVGICGIWGSGKSTLSSSIYDEISYQFEGCCFIKNVRGESRMHGLKTLQEKLLSDVLKSKVTLDSIEKGVSMMTRRLRQSKVFIVLDDVDHIDHLKMLAGSHDWFGDGSRIIFTTRNQDLVNAHNCITHNVRMLNDTEAIELCSRHAFGEGRRVEGYDELFKSIVSKFGGHPSALKSFASFLHDKDMIEWMSIMARLEGIPVEGIREKFNAGVDGVSRDLFSWLLNSHS